MTLLRFFLGSLILSCSCIAAAGNTNPTRSETHTALEQLVELLAHHQQWQANFVQQVTDDRGELVQRTEGSLYAQKPFKLYWQANEPYPETIVSNGKTLWRYDPDLEQVIIEQLSSDFQQTPVLIFSGDKQAIAETYVVSGANGKFELLPRDDSNLFLSLAIELDAQQVYSLSIVDTLSQTSTTSFTSYSRSSDIDDSMFEFQIPEGVDIVSQ